MSEAAADASVEVSAEQQPLASLPASSQPTAFDGGIPTAVAVLAASSGPAAAQHRRVQGTPVVGAPQHWPAEDRTMLNQLLDSQDRPVAGLHWSALPPLPEPRYDKQRQESCAGCSLVVGVISACVAATHGSVRTQNRPLIYPYLDIIGTNYPY